MLKPQIYVLQEKLLFPATVLLNPVVRLLKVPFCREKEDNLHQRRPERILAFASSQVTTLAGSRRYSSKRLSSSFNCSSVTGISSGLEDNSSQSSTAKSNLSAVESFCSSGIVSLIMPTRLPYSGPSRNWWKASRSGDSIVFPPIQGRMERFKKPLPAKCRIERKILFDILESRARDIPE